jgi:hypothetical protein
MEITPQKITFFKNEAIKKLENELESFLQEFNPAQIVYFESNIDTNFNISKKEKLSLFLAYFSNEFDFYIHSFKEHQFIFNFNIFNKLLYYEILFEIAIECEFYEFCPIFLQEKNKLVHLTEPQENITKKV